MSREGVMREFYDYGTSSNELPGNLLCRLLLVCSQEKVCCQK